MWCAYFAVELAFELVETHNGQNGKMRKGSQSIVDHDADDDDDDDDGAHPTVFIEPCLLLTMSVLAVCPATYC